MIRKVLLIGIVPVLACFANNTNSPLWNETWSDRLKQHLLYKYDKFARPSEHWDATTIHTLLNILHIELNDEKNIMAVNCWVVLNWMDNKLKWNSSDYGGLKKVNMGIHEIWQPDIYLFNSASHGVEHYGDIYCLVKEDGDVTWVVPTIFYGYCHLDFTFWPFDTHSCTLRLGTWTYGKDEIDLKLSDTGVELIEYYSISEWIVKNATGFRRTVKHVCCTDPIVYLDFDFTLTRASELYYHIAFVPTVPIVFMTLIGFWLEPYSEMKLVINMSTLVLVTVFLIFFGQKIPPRTDSMPILVRFYSGCIYQITVSAVISAVVMNISKREFCTPLPRFIKSFLMGKFGRCLGLCDLILKIQAPQRQIRSDECDDNHFTMSYSTLSSFEDDRQQIMPTVTKSSELEWILLATAIDRLSFLVLCFVFVIMAITCVHSKHDVFVNNSSAHFMH